MNKIKKLFIAFLFLVFFQPVVSAQKQYTPYDNFPGIIKEYKPAYQNTYPEWGKMLYLYPVNFYELTEYTAIHKNEKNALTRYFKIWTKVVAPHVLDDGTIELPSLKKYYSGLKATQLKAFSKQNTNDSANWTFLGPVETFRLNTSGSGDTIPCPWQANVYSFDIAPSDNNILFCGTETGYVNKTVDAGLHWQLMAPEYPFGGGITAVCIHPSNPNIVFVSAGNQIHKTTDGGNTWTPMLNNHLFYANQITIDPVNPQKIFTTSSNGIYISADGGISWTQKWAAPSWDIELNPGNHNTVYALTKNGNHFALAVSNDGGATFNLE